jgi:hypothetical protein
VWCQWSQRFSIEKNERKGAAEKYCPFNATEMEEIVCTYGYLMDKWDLSQIQDLSYLFGPMVDGHMALSVFTRDFGSWEPWNVFNVTTDMRYIFSFLPHLSTKTLDLGMYPM